ncbi:ribonuclease J [Candidatus Sumerlaeota bacterium]|nr:ribonuclease J [Candidatus Sumerlaeota bacterium]
MPDSSIIRIVPLGGLGEVGMNMMLLECGEDAILIDCGQCMPSEDTPGIDVVIPDISHLRTLGSRLRGILLTHGHEDHIGALPYLWPELRVPLYGREVTLALVHEKLREFSLEREVPLERIEPREEIRLGGFGVRFIHVTHSIAQASALILTTPAGVVVHSGDYKMDGAPLDGEAFDEESLRQAGDAGVLALLGDSTNADVPGHTLSESDLIEPLEKLVRGASGTVVVCCFASATHRHRLVLDIARRTGRRVVLAGLSMVKNMRIWRELGLLDVPNGILADASEYGEIPSDRRIVLATGSQGEPRSAMTRIALDEHRHISLEEGDVYIHSARFIPGNERAIARMINHLHRRGVSVHQPPGEMVHCSGHARRDEMSEMLRLTRPRHLVPIHGEIRHLMAHRRLALEMGMAEDCIHILENGDALEISSEGARRAGDCEAGRVFVDGLGVGDIDDVVLRDRRHLSKDGMVVVILAVDRQTRQLMGGPDIVSRGFVHIDESEDVVEECKAIAREAFESLASESREESTEVEEEVRRALRRFIKRRFARRPMVLPVVMEV